MADLLNTLVAKHGLHLQDVTIIGHSLGAHIAGLTGKKLKTSKKLGCIIGLDPAGVGFYNYTPETRINQIDAEYVQIIHTNGETFGIREPIGHGKYTEITLS